MLHHYNDIRSRISEPPKWWDEEGVPRYVDFAPDEVANIYAQEVALVDIACQSCGTRFKVAFSWANIEWHNGAPELHKRLTPEHIVNLHYGDPPNVGCCPAGATMNCDDLRVLEFWRKGGEEFTKPDPKNPKLRICLPGYFDWRRVPELEVLLPDHPDFVAAVSAGAERKEVPDA